MQMLQGIQHLHSLSVLHLDIKADNVLYGGPQGKTIKIADFGMASYSKDVNEQRLRGTRVYMAPEMLAKEGYSSPADIWSFGVLCYAILVGKFPIGSSDDTPAELTSAIVQVEKQPNRLVQLAAKLRKAATAYHHQLCVYYAKQSVGKMFSTSTSENVSDMLADDTGLVGLSNADLTMKHASATSRLKVVELIMGLLQRSPQDRYTAGTALQAPMFFSYRCIRGIPHSEICQDIAWRALTVNRERMTKQTGSKAQKAKAQRTPDARGAKQPTKPTIQPEKKVQRAAVAEAHVPGIPVPLPEVPEVAVANPEGNFAQEQRLCEDPASRSCSTQNRNADSSLQNRNAEISSSPSSVLPSSSSATPATPAPPSANDGIDPHGSFHLSVGNEHGIDIMHERLAKSSILDSLPDHHRSPGHGLRSSEHEHLPRRANTR